MKEILDWSIMIYFGGDNNLSEEMIWAIKDIQSWRRSQSPGPRKVKVSILFDAGGPPVPIDDDELLTRDARAVTSEKLSAAAEAYGAIDGDTGAAAILDRTVAVREKADKKGTVSVPSVETTLRDFILRIFREQRAKHHMVVLSGHGSGDRQSVV